METPERYGEDQEKIGEIAEKKAGDLTAEIQKIVSSFQDETGLQISEIVVQEIPRFGVGPNPIKVYFDVRVPGSEIRTEFGYRVPCIESRVPRRNRA